MADAAASKAVVGNHMRVQLPLSAFIYKAPTAQMALQPSSNFYKIHGNITFCRAGCAE